jgi:hypothetical protein
LDNPVCVDSAQAQRILPFFAGIGERWEYAKNVARLDQKIIESLTHYRKDPDGILFEILVALSYAAKGWHVELLEEKPPAKSPDMVVRKGGIELFVECKRLNRRTAYSEKEQTEFLRLWDKATPVLIQNRQWLWLKAVFHAEVFTLPNDFLAHILQRTLPIGGNETILHEDADATIHARPIDRQAVNTHLDKFMVKEPSPMLCNLLGGDWAPENAEMTVIVLAKRGHMDGCEAPVLSTYIEAINWACGITRKFDSDTSIEKKARDITSLLADAVKQVPHDKPSVIHVAAETLEGRDVELRRTEKVMSRIQSFLTDKPVLAVRFHRLQSNSRTNMLFEFDETVEQFQVTGSETLLEDIPSQVIVPDHATFVDGRHWEIYE